MSKFNIFFLLFYFSMLFCDDLNGYRFISSSSHEKYLYEVDVINEFQQNNFSFMGTFTGRLATKFVADTSFKHGEIKVVQTWSNIISTNRRNDDVKPNYDAQKLEGCIFTIVMDSTGMTEYTEGNNDLARETISEMESFSSMFGANNFIYPFGSDSLRKVGDVWYVKEESHLEAFSGMDDFDGTRKVVNTYTFKKTKKKKGDLIAVINSDQTIELEGIFQNWDETYEVQQTGLFKGKMEFNLTKNYFQGSKMGGELSGYSKSLRDDDEDRFVMYFDLKFKNKVE